MNQYFSYIAYVVSGGVAFGVNIILTYFLTEFIGFWYMLSIVIGTLTSWSLMFILNKSITFKNLKLKSTGSAYFKNIFLYIILMPVGLGSIYFLTSVVGLYYLLSQVVVVVIMSIISFFLTQYFVFKF